MTFLLLLCSKLFTVNNETKKMETKEYILTDQEQFLFPSEGLITAIDKSGSHANNKAVDIANKKGTSIMAAMNGKVNFTGVKEGYGNCIILDHNDAYSTLYGHLSLSLVKEGQIVRRGEEIGLMGSTGNSTGSHLHFEVRQNQNSVNILKYFPFLEMNLYVKSQANGLAARSRIKE